MTSPTGSLPPTVPPTVTTPTATVSATPVLPTGSATPRPAFSPQPRRDGLIAFVSERSGTADLYLVEPTGGAATQLTRGPAWDLQPAWS
ncbi:MAG TPA: hypothetical protein VFK38_04715, partial [Candidatus Limnocylindrales bacterium]|nr:hypothetical protein [Candidatus Limnocylindrales bacterium]